MAKILLDTSILIDFQRRKDKENSPFLALVKKYDLHISILTVVEIYAGKSVWEKKDLVEEIEFVFSNMKIIELSKEIAKKSGEIKAKNNIDLADSIIAATALLSNLELATLNIKDFEKIKRITLYPIKT